MFEVRFRKNCGADERGGSTHSDATLRLLKAGGGATEDEESILSAFEWSKNEAVLHWDERVRLCRL